MLLVTDADAGMRLDVFLASKHPDRSRSFFQKLIESQRVTVNGLPAKSNHKVSPSEEILCTIPPPEPAQPEAEAIALDVLYEDDDLLVVNKPPGMVVHPAPGAERSTLVNALLHHCPDLSGIGGVKRPGIIHRLDRDTSGAIIVAKNDSAHHALSAQVQSRAAERRYLALAYGHFKERQGVIDAPIGRSIADTKRMAVSGLRGRHARTKFEVVREFGEFLTLLRVKLETGRTHQIRVHLAFIGHPVAGDQTYGNLTHWLKRWRALGLEPPRRQMLHAEKVRFSHPRSGQVIEVVAPLAVDMASVIEALEKATLSIDLA